MSRFKLTWLVAVTLAATICKVDSGRADEATSAGCYVSAEVAVSKFCKNKPQIRRGRGPRTALATAIWQAAHKLACTEGGRAVMVTGATKLCEYSVEKVGEEIKIRIKSAKDGVHEMALTYDWLHSYEGMSFLTVKMSGN